jgi:hypothetical protein
METFGFHTYIFQQLPHHCKPAACKEVSFHIVTITGVTTRYKNSVSTLLKGVDYKKGIYSTGTHHPDNMNVGGVLYPAGSSKIRSSIGAPVTQKSYYVGFKLLAHLIPPSTAICGNICSSLKDFCWMEPDKQPATQAPQPLQTASLTLATWT